MTAVSSGKRLDHASPRAVELALHLLLHHAISGFPFPHNLGHVCRLNPVDLLEKLLDARPPLRAGDFASGNARGHFTILSDRLAVRLGGLAVRNQVLFHALIDAFPPLALARAEDMGPKAGSGIGIVAIARRALRTVSIEILAGGGDVLEAGSWRTLRPTPPRQPLSGFPSGSLPGLSLSDYLLQEVEWLAEQSIRGRDVT